MAIGLTNTLPRSSCGKCVKALKELISGLDDRGGENSNSKSNSKSYEPPPLTLLRAIARSSQDHRWHDKWGQERKLDIDWYRQQQQQQQRRHNNDQTDSGNTNTDADSIADSISDAVSNSNNVNSNNHNARRLLFPGEEQHQQHHHRNEHPILTIEETKDGVRLTIPVETTAPAFMKKWTQLEQQPRGDVINERKSGHQGEQDDDEAGGVLEDWIPLATSVRRDEDENSASSSSAVPVAAVADPLTIELTCRRCETFGPEAGARAFLMGPQPLSIVLCHNRIDSDKAEVEEILTHELIHLYDVQTLKLDLADCETVAYSEVRAAREAECDRSVRDAAAAKAASEASNASASSGFQAVTTQISETLQKRVYKPYCVRNIALGATQNMFPREGKACLNKVWETAYGDHRPFARHEHQQQHHNGNNDKIHGNGNNWKADEPSHESNIGTSHGTSGK